MSELTRGERLVGVSFNPSSRVEVDEVKAAAAALIDLVDKYADNPRAEAVAITNIEQGCMWAVKSIVG